MPKYSTNTKTDVIVHLGIIISVILILFFSFFFIYLPWSTNHGKSVTVPDLKGLSMDEAENLLDNTDLEFEVSDSVFVPGAKPLSVLSNYPRSGARVKVGRKIYLTLAAMSAPMVKMPNIIGRSTSSAQNQLLSSGLLFGGEEEIPALEENTVLKIKINGSEITPGSDVPKGSKVILVVGDGYGNQMIDVPNVSGMAYDEADIYLSGLGLTVGTVLYEPSEQADGIVIRQKPASGEGEKIKIGSSVNLWVSGTAPATTAPPSNP